MEIGSYIRAARKARGLSQDQLARRADIPLNGVQRIETGVVQDPHYSTLAKIAGAMGLSVSELLGDTEAPKALGPLPELRDPGDIRRAVEFLEHDLREALPDVEEETIRSILVAHENYLHKVFVRQLTQLKRAEADEAVENLTNMVSKSYQGAIKRLQQGDKRVQQGESVEEEIPGR